MPEGALTTTTYPNLNFRPLPVQEGWSDFIRSGEAGTGAIIETIVPGAYLEVRDKRFKSDSLIVIRRSDFERLVKGARQVANASSRVKRILISISKTTASVSINDPTVAYNMISAIHEQAGVALEMARTLPVYQTEQEFFSAEAANLGGSEGVSSFPKNKAELNYGVRKKK